MPQVPQVAPCPVRLPVQAPQRRPPRLVFLAPADESLVEGAARVVVAAENDDPSADHAAIGAPVERQTTVPQSSVRADHATSGLLIQALDESVRDSPTCLPRQDRVDSSLNVVSPHVSVSDDDDVTHRGL